MSFIYLQAQGEESSAECFSDIPAFVLSRLNLTREKSCCNGSETESCHAFLSGMTCEHLMGDHGGGLSIASVEGSLAKISAPPEGPIGKGLVENDQDYGPSSPESLAKYNPGLRSWKTAQLSLFGGLEAFSGIWPRWGMMLGGECFPLPMLAHDTSVRGYGLLPAIGTPIKTQTSRSEDFMSPAQTPFEICKAENGKPRPEWCEHLMLWPIGWTDIAPLATDRFRQWRRLHGAL